MQVLKMMNLRSISLQYKSKYWDVLLLSLQFKESFC